MRRIVVGLLFAAWSLLACACINTVATDRTGQQFFQHWYTGDELVESLTWRTTRAGRSVLDDESRRLAKDVKATPDFAHRNDLAVNLIRQGETTAAMRLLVANERDFPGRPETAANLGTALELAGFDAIALRWIRIGIQRNADEHEGTEWLHARILEAKVAARRDPGYFATHSVAGVRFEDMVLPPLPTAYPPGNDGRPVSSFGLNQALSYQLHERLQFVRSSDPVVANLLLDWATLNLAGGAIEDAKALYGLAVRYGARSTPLMQARLARIDAILAGPKRDAVGPCTICAPSE
ncbi:MAG: hypothetical protein ACTHOH_15530 [Lysobacteraceae bacterium]